MKPVVLFQTRWSGVANLVGGIVAAVAGICMIFSKQPFGIVLLLVGIGACVYGGMLLNAVNDDDNASS